MPWGDEPVVPLQPMSAVPIQPPGKTPAEPAATTPEPTLPAVGSIALRIKISTPGNFTTSFAPNLLTGVPPTAIQNFLALSTSCAAKCT